MNTYWIEMKYYGEWSSIEMVRCCRGVHYHCPRSDFDSSSYEHLNYFLTSSANLGTETQRHMYKVGLASATNCCFSYMGRTYLFLECVALHRSRIYISGSSTRLITVLGLNESLWKRRPQRSEVALHTLINF